MPNYCPSCGEVGYNFLGNDKAKYLLVFNKPYPASVGVVNRYKKQQLSGLDVLRKEMSKCGMDLQNDFRLSWIWLHEISKNLECREYGKNLVLDSAKNKKVVILVGAEPVEEFTGLSASDVYGLQVESPTFSAPTVFVLPKPESIFVRGQGIGELRLSVQKLERLLR